MMLGPGLLSVTGMRYLASPGFRPLLIMHTSIV